MKPNIFANIQLTQTEKQALKASKIAFEQQIIDREALVKNKSLGFFGPDSMTWKIYREPTLLLGGVSALLLQIAHPSVAQGVQLFSNFHQEYLYRAQRTFAAMAGFYFGNTALALKTARHLFQMHSMIRGTVVRTINGEKQTLPFCAKDPELLCWVLATLVHTSLTIYELLHHPLHLDEKKQFFEESKTLAILMGIPPKFYPTDLEGFYHYYHIMLYGNQLEVGETALGLSDIILHPPYGSYHLLKWMGGGLLPAHLARAYQISLTEREQGHFRKLVRGSKFIVRCLPAAIRYSPPYHQAHYRVKRAQGQRPFHLGRIYDWLAKTMHFPFCIQND